MKRSLLAMLLLAGCATPAAWPDPTGEPLGWVCQRHFPSEGRHFWVTRELDRAGTAIGDTALWRAPRSETEAGVELGWTLPADGPWHVSPDFVGVDFTLVPAPAAAVQALLYSDSRLVARREVVDRRSARAARGFARFGASLFFGPGAGPVPPLHGVRAVEIVAVEEGGREIARLRPPLPDWAELDRWVAEGRAGIDADARSFEARCEPRTGPEI